MKIVIKSILNENNNDNIILEFNDLIIEFEQVALILVRNNTYSILRPITVLEGIDNDEGYIFLIDEDNNKIIYVQDEDVIDEVYDVYFNLLGDNF